MTQQIINIGTAPNDGTGDQLRLSFDKCNLNFTELYAGVAKGVSIGSAIEYQFNNTITEPPASGQIRFNQATQASTTKLWASHTTSSGINIKQFLSAATTGAKLILQDENDNTNYIKFDVTGAPIDKTTYWEFAVAVTESGGNLPNAAILAAVTAAAGGGGAPVGAEYITSTTDATLTAERVLTDTATITWDRTTPGQIKASAAAGGNVSNSGTPTVGQFAQWVTATTIEGTTAPAPNCGRLEYVSATALSFTPFNGDRIKINGILYPVSGIAGLANTGVFVNGVAGQNLAIATLYYVYAFSNSGTITADFSTTAHATSSTALNVGVEIKSGDNTRTLIGMIRTGGTAQFYNTSTFRQVISWFNRKNIIVLGPATNVATASTSAVELDVNARGWFLAWANTDIITGLSGWFNNNAAQTNYAYTFIDGGGVNTFNAYPLFTHTAGWYGSLSGVGGVANLSEGLHFVSPAGYVSGGTGTFALASTALISG